MADIMGDYSSIQRNPFFAKLFFVHFCQAQGQGQRQRQTSKLDPEVGFVMG